ncbi:MAG: hypothetical protein Q9219_006087 [cf. Caloplaca sp. 3 TL-2023]
MHFPTTTSTLASLLAIPLAIPLAGAAESGPMASPPTTTFAFSGTVDVAVPLAPIRIPGGVRIVEPITGGTFSGPILNATVAGGFAFPAALANGTVQDAEIEIYGTTGGNQSFLVRVEGVGTPGRQVARLTIEVGGKEAGLADRFLLATINPSADRRTVAVDGYLVG